MELNPIEQVNFITIVSIIILFTITFFILKRIFFDPLIEIMEKRTEKIERSKSLIDEAKNLLESAREESEKIINEAQTKAERIRTTAKEEALRIKDEKIFESKKKAEELLIEGRREIEMLKVEEKKKLASELLSCTQMTLEKLVERVDEKVLKAMIDKSISEIESLK